MSSNSRLNSVCAASMLISIGGQARPAQEWAAIHGVKWTTVKMRRYRGLDWDKAFKPQQQGRKPNYRCGTCGKICEPEGISLVA
ncbi:hypothetical protein [Pseudomonas sp.]|uniref:hypothetical protein n=1 Tax=Pseudomonas sp. TaxID=306 RepID=UPI0026186C3F|nr:hypothetical protein [Pseudomonas sp.]